MQEPTIISNKGHHTDIYDILPGIAADNNLGYQITDLKGNILEINDVGAQIFGLNENLSRSVNFFDLLSTANKKITNKIYHDLESDNLKKEKLQITSGGKEIQVLQIHFYLIKLPLKKDNHVLGVYNRINTPKLNNDKWIYTQITKISNDAVIIIDAQTEKVLEVNDLACEIYGFSRTTFLKKSLKDTLGSKSNLERNLIFQILNQKKNYVGEILINTDGKAITLEVHANEVDYKERKAILCVNRDLTLKKEIQKELLDEKNRGLSALIDGQEMERRRLSREMHDGIGQLLTTSQIYLKQLKKNINSESLKTVDKIQKILETTMQEVRSISHNLMPSVLDDFGLPLALKHMVNNLNNNLETNIEIFIADGLGRMDPEIEVGLYRIAQEALNNALKYAKGAKIEISLNKKKEGLELTIKDNGNGFSIDSNNMKHEGNGISNMAQRASSIGCDFRIKSQKGKGTLIWAHYNFKHE